MGIQIIKGIVQDVNTDPWANRVIEVSFSDGYVPLSPLNVSGRTDSNGAFRIPVDNNQSAVKAAILRLPDDSLFGFDLDPEDATVDLGTLIASGVEGVARLLPVPDGIKVYRAILSQSGGGAPLASVFENTLGGDVVWTRSSAGNYAGTLAGAFPVDKTFIVFNPGGGSIGGLMCAAVRVNDNVIQIQSQELQIDFVGEAIDPQNVDGCFDAAAIEILVYP